MTGGPAGGVAVRAFAAACLGIGIFSCMDAVMKGLSLAIGAYGAMLWRTLAGTAISAPVWLAARPRRPDRRSIRLHVWRGAVTAVMAILFFWGLARVPMAQAVALSFIAPLIALYLAAVLLGETIGRGAIGGSAIAFVGVAGILAGQVRAAPGEQAWLGTAAILGSAVCYAYNIILQRRQAMAAPPLEIAFFQSITVFAFLMLAAPFVGMPSPAGHWPAIMVAACCALASLMLLSWAYARAEANYLVPVEYTAFLWAAALGWLVFGEPIRPATLIGAALIVGGCCYAARRRPAPLAEAAL